MTLEEAIRHCEEVANKCEVEYQKSPYILGYREEFFNNFECAAEHRQLAEWLKELNERRGQNEDVAQIVRCKDCEYGEQDEDGWWYCRSFGCQVGDEDGSGFCSEAERRTDEAQNE